MSQLLASGGQSIGASPSASVFPMVLKAPNVPPHHNEFWKMPVENTYVSLFVCVCVCVCVCARARARAVSLRIEDVGVWPRVRAKRESQRLGPAGSNAHGRGLG